MTCRKTELMFDLQRFAGDDVALVVDVNGDKAPQYFNPNQGANGAYEYAAGSGGAPRVQLYDHLGNPISSTNKLHVQETELQSRIGALNAAAVTNPASNASVIAALKGLLTLLGPLAGTVEDGAAKVTLSGSIEEIVIDRQVRTSEVTVDSILVPVHARGAIVSALIRGVTGTFGQDEGYRLRVINSNSIVPSPFANVQYRITDTRIDPSTTSNRSQIVVIYPGEFKFEPYSSGVAGSALVQSPIGPLLAVRLDITGTFAPGEGVDCEVRVTWIR